MQIVRQVSRIESKAKAIADDDRRLAQIAEEQRQRRAQMAAAKERLLVDLGHEIGLLDLPAPAMARIVTSLKGACAQESVAAPTKPTAMTAQEQPKADNTRPTTRARRSTGGADDGTAEIVVKSSRNAGAVKRSALEKAGLRWNGKSGCWRGRVDADMTEQLRSMFGERVSVAVEAPSTKATRLAPIVSGPGSESGTEAPAPVMSGGAPAVVEDAPAGDGADLQKPVEPPPAVQGSDGEPPAVPRTPAPSRPLPRPLPPAAADH